MNLKQLITFGIEESQEPVIKNPVLRAALEGPSITAQEPRNMAHGGRTGFANGPPTLDVKTRKANVGMEKISIGPSGTENVRKIVYRNRATGEEIIRYKPRVGEAKLTNPNKPHGYTTLKDASGWVDNYYKENPKKIRIKDPEKDYITKDKRRFHIDEKGGVESYKAAKEGSGIEKGHSTNVEGKNLIKPKNIIYTPQDINSMMGGKKGAVNKKNPSSFDSLDLKQRNTEAKIEEIKKSNMPTAKKKIELGKLDDKLMKYVAQSDGYKTAVLSSGKEYGSSFQSTKSMDMFDQFPGKSEKEVKNFVGQYFKLDGELKPKYKNLSKEEMLKLPQSVKDNIVKAGIFNENVKNAQKNAAKVLTGWCSPGKQRVGKDEGGRIGFGGCSDGEKITNMKNAASKLKQHKLYLMGKATTTPFASNAAAKALALKMTKSGGLLMRIGKVAMGPLTLWGEPLFEGAFIAHDILGTGTPWKEAVAKSLWAKPAISMGLLKPADQQYDEALWQVQNEEGEALMIDPYHERVRTPIKRFIDNNKKIDKLNKLFTLKQNSHIMGPRLFTQEERETKIKNADETYNNYLKSLGGAEGVKDIENQISEDQEAYDTRVAALEIERQGITEDDIFTPSGLKRPGVERDADIKQKQAEEDLMYQKYGKTRATNVGIEGTSGEFKKQWITDPELKDAFIPEEVLDPNFMKMVLNSPTEQSHSPNYPKTYHDLYPTPASRYGWSQMGPIAQAGGVANMATGGIMSLKKKKW